LTYHPEIKAASKRVLTIISSVFSLPHTLNIHLFISTISFLSGGQQCQEMNKPLTPDELGEKVRNPQFLNALQAGVNTWIKEIYKVTKLERYIFVLL
jgi:hypothetical protein